MGNANTEKVRMRRKKNPEKERERKRRQKANKKARSTNIPEETRIEVKTRLRTRRTRRLRKLLVRISGEQNHRCCYCGHKTWIEGVECNVERLTWNQSTKEHITPQSKGGTFGYYNMVMACSSCNGTRGDMDYNDFIELITTEPKPVIIKKQHTAKEDKEERAIIRQAEFAYQTALYLSYLTVEQRQIVNGWVEEYKRHQHPSGIDSARKRRKLNKSGGLSKVRKRIRQTNIDYAIA